MKNYLILISILFLSFQSYSQGLRVNSELPVNIDASGSSPHQSAMLDVKSTSKGVLVPRMTTSQRNSINSPAKGLLVFDTNTNTFWFHNGSSWKDLGSDTTLTESQVDIFVSDNGYLTSEVDGDPFNEIELPVNPSVGTMVYYNGSNWSTIPPGNNDDKLCYCNGIPMWGSGPCPGSGGGGNCSDGIQNQGEQGIDCGGPCPDQCCDNLTITHLDDSGGDCELHTLKLNGVPFNADVSWTWNIQGTNFSGVSPPGSWSVFTFSTLPGLTPGSYSLFLFRINIFKACLINDADALISATDAGREGELIFRLIYRFIIKINPCYYSSFETKI